MNHSQVAINAHHGEAEDAGELVNAINGHDQPACKWAEGPRVHGVLHGEEWKAQHEELIGYS